jgi:hypothetical protein
LSKKVYFTPLCQAATADLLRLLNDHRVTKHMPLAEPVDSGWVDGWKREKSRLWTNPEHGPWAVYLDDEFAGWAGMQPDGENEVDFAIVLHVWAWRTGREIAKDVLAKWKTISPESDINIYLPTSRPIHLISQKLGLEIVGEDKMLGHKFVKLRFTDSSNL